MLRLEISFLRAFKQVYHVQVPPITSVTKDFHAKTWCTQEKFCDFNNDLTHPLQFNTALNNLFFPYQHLFQLQSQSHIPCVLNSSSFTQKLWLQCNEFSKCKCCLLCATGTFKHTERIHFIKQTSFDAQHFFASHRTSRTKSQKCLIGGTLKKEELKFLKERILNKSFCFVVFCR